MEMPQQVLYVLQKLTQAGYHAYVVGGAIRDILLGREVSDWDVTTDAGTNELRTIFRAHHCLELGIAFGILQVLVDGLWIEVSTYRGEEATLYADLAKRDFTMNAMAYAPGEGLVDYFDGQAALRAREIRAVGDAAARFAEDPLRIFRALRFSAQLAMSIAAQTAAALLSVSVEHVACERIAAELTKLLLGPNVRDVLRSYGPVLALAIPEIRPMLGFLQHNPYHVHDVWNHTAEVVAHTPADPVLRWAALFHDMGKPETYSCDEKGIGHFYGHGQVSLAHANAIMQRLHFSRDWQTQIAFLVEYHDMPVPQSVREVKKVLQRMGQTRFEQLLALFAADCAGQSSLSRARHDEIIAAQPLLEEALRENGRFTRKDLAISGVDLLKLGFSGKALGEMLEELVAAVVFEGLPNTREALLEHVRGKEPRA